MLFAQTKAQIMMRTTRGFKHYRIYDLTFTNVSKWRWSHARRIWNLFCDVRVIYTRCTIRFDKRTFFWCLCFLGTRVLFGLLSLWIYLYREEIAQLETKYLNLSYTLFTTIVNIDNSTRMATCITEDGTTLVVMCSTWLNRDVGTIDGCPPLLVPSTRTTQPPISLFQDATLTRHSFSEASMPSRRINACILSAHVYRT